MTIAKSQLQAARDSSSPTGALLRKISSGPRASFGLLIALCICGLIVRLLGMRLGLPYLHHWDECWVVWNARNMLETSSTRPTTFQYGAPLSLLIAWAVRLFNLLPGHLPIGFGDEVALRWFGRAISIVLCSSGTAALYVTGVNVAPDQESRRRLGLYAAATYAFAYELVIHARYAVTDGVLVACCAWAIATGAVYLRTKRLRWALASLLCAATAFAFKFTALPTVLIPIACLFVTKAPLEARRRLALRALQAGALPIVVVGFIALNWHFIDSWHRATADLAQRMAQTRDGGFSHCYIHEPGLDHLRHVLWALFGHTLSRWVPLACLLGAFSIAGIAWGLARQSQIVMIAAIHASIVVCGLAFTVRTLVLRNYLTAVPVMCLGVALAVEFIRSAAARSGWGSGGAKSWLVCAPLVPLFALGVATARDSLANQRLSQDARVRALDWIAAHTNDEITTVSLTPSVMAPGEHLGTSALKILQRPKLRFLRASLSCNDLKRSSPDYVISASYRGPDVPTVDYDERWYFTQCEGYQPVARFEPNPYESTFWVYPTWVGRVSAVVLARRRSPTGTASR